MQRSSTIEKSVIKYNQIFKKPASYKGPLEFNRPWAYLQLYIAGSKLKENPVTYCMLIVKRPSKKLSICFFSFKFKVLLPTTYPVPFQDNDKDK